MSEELHPVARAFLGDSEEADRTIACAVCGAQTVCPGFIVAAVKVWNELHKDTERPIRPSEMGVTCDGPCTAELYKRKHAAVREEQQATRTYLAMLFVGKYNPESLEWLRTHGCATQVKRVLAEEGNKSHGF